MHQRSSKALKKHDQEQSFQKHSHNIINTNNLRQLQVDHDSATNLISPKILDQFQSPFKTSTRQKFLNSQGQSFTTSTKSQSNHYVKAMIENLQMKENKPNTPTKWNYQYSDFVVEPKGNNKLNGKQSIRFQDEFDQLKMNNMMGRRQSNSVSHQNSNGFNTSEIFKPSTPIDRREQEVKNIMELDQLDLHHQHSQLKSENLMLKQQIQQYQTQICHSDSVIKKLKLNLQSLTQLNAQLKDTNDKLSNDKVDLEQKSQTQMLSMENMQQQLGLLKQQITEYSKIEGDIQQMEIYYLDLFQNISRDIRYQQTDLHKLQIWIDNLSLIATRLAAKQEVPLDQLFKHRQHYQLHQEQPIQDLLESQKSNTKTIETILQTVSKQLELISIYYVEEFSKRMIQ